MHTKLWVTLLTLVVPVVSHRDLSLHPFSRTWSTTPYQLSPAPYSIYSDCLYVSEGHLLYLQPESAPCCGDRLNLLAHNPNQSKLSLNIFIRASNINSSINANVIYLNSETLETFDFWREAYRCAKLEHDYDRFYYTAQEAGNVDSSKGRTWCISHSLFQLKRSRCLM